MKNHIEHNVDSCTQEGCKICLYILQSERAVEEIKRWPKWMQNNLKPPTETIRG